MGGLRVYSFFSPVFSFFPSVDLPNVSTEVCIVLFRRYTLLIYLIRVLDCYRYCTINIVDLPNVLTESSGLLQVMGPGSHL